MDVARVTGSDVFVGIASFGRRGAMLKGAVDSLIDQVDRVGVYLNNYVSVPGFLDHPKIEVALSQDHGDQRDNGKFFFLNQSDHRFYASADDDLLYPYDFIQVLRRVLAEAGEHAAVAVHGAVYPHPILDFAGSRALFHFKDPLKHVMPVHLVGTGTLMFDQSAWDLTFEEFGEPGMADVWFGLAAKKRENDLFVVNRSRDWVKASSLAQPDERPAMRLPTLFAEGEIAGSRHTELLSKARVSEGGLESLLWAVLKRDRFAEDFTLSQALAFDDLRRELGLLSLPEEAGESVTARISDARSHRYVSDPGSDNERDAYIAAMSGVLTQSLDVEVAATALDLLDRLELLAKSDNKRWKALPYSLRFDTRGSRLDDIRLALEKVAVRESPTTARRLWPRMSQSLRSIPIDLALDFERAGIETDFQRLPTLQETAKRNPIRAGLALLEYFEANDWAGIPDVAAWRTAFGGAFTTKEIQLLLTLVAQRTDQREMAVGRLGLLRHRWPADMDVQILAESDQGLAASRPFAALERVLTILDQAIEPLGLQPYGGCLSGRPLQDSGHWIDCFVPSADPIEDASSPSVTVIMTVYNNRETIQGAVASVLASGGVALELIVVDDASTDGTTQLLHATGDSRVKVLRNETRLGPYVSRNRALVESSGEYITIADADDWSHPDRIGYQCRLLKQCPELVACKVAHLRIRPNGEADLENHLLFVGDGPMSLMFRRSVISQVGGFDHVRTRGDIEFIRRLQARFGHQAIASFGAPLVLATSSPSSNSKQFSEEMLERYRRAAWDWHANGAMSDRLYVPYEGSSRAGFIAPAELVVGPVDDDREP